ncbi:MAG: hypothetical protein AAF556_07195 [Pseudomonadota bacterium]
MSSGLSRDLINLAAGDAPSTRDRNQSTYFEARLAENLDKCPFYMRGEVAGQYISAAPRAMLYALTEPMRDKINSALQTEPVQYDQVEAQARMRALALGSGEFAQLDCIELDLAYFEHLGPHGGQPAADRTAEFINGLPALEAMSLQTDTQIKMMRALQVARQPTEAIAKARSTLHSSIHAGDTYYQNQAAYRSNLADKLAHDTRVQKALMEWPDMDEKTRLNLLQHVVDTQARLGQFEPVPVVAKRWPVKTTEDGETLTRRGTYNPSARNISVNAAAEAFWEDPVKVIGTTVHENTHNRQHQLGEDYERGLLNKDDPNHVAGALFADGLVYGYIHSSVDHTLYRNQLVEQQARSIQDTVVGRLNGLGIKANHEADAEIEAFLAEWSRDDGDDVIPDFEILPPDRPNGP